MVNNRSKLQYQILYSGPLTPYVLTAGFLIVGLFLSVFAVALAGIEQRLSIAMACGGSLFVGSLALLIVFLLSDRNVRFDAARRELLVFGHRWSRRPHTTHKLGARDGLLLSSTQTRSVRLSRLDVVTSSTRHLIALHKDHAMMTALAENAARSTGLPIADERTGRERRDLGGEHQKNY